MSGAGAGAVSLPDAGHMSLRCSAALLLGQEPVQAQAAAAVSSHLQPSLPSAATVAACSAAAECSLPQSSGSSSSSLQASSRPCVVLSTLLHVAVAAALTAATAIGGVTATTTATMTARRRPGAPGRASMLLEAACGLPAALSWCMRPRPLAVSSTAGRCLHCTKQHGCSRNARHGHGQRSRTIHPSGAAAAGAP